MEFSIHITSQGSLSFATPMQEAAALLVYFVTHWGRTAEGRMFLTQAGPLLLILVKQSQLKGCWVRDLPWDKGRGLPSLTQLWKEGNDYRLHCSQQLLSQC